MKIHNTSIVSDGAKIEEGVEIGPFCIIEDEVIIGRNTKIVSHCIIESGTEIGSNNYIGRGTIIGGLPQDVKFKGEKSKVVIGNNNIIREYVTINRACGEGEKTEVGDNNYIMTQVHFGHNCKIGSNTIITNNTALAGYVEVEDAAVISGLVGVHQFVRIGKYSMTGGLSAVRQDVPPYSLVVGNPAYLVGINSVGLRRAGFSSSRVNDIKSVFRILFMSGLNMKDAIESIKDKMSTNEDISYLISFLQKSKRGITKWGKES